MTADAIRSDFCELSALYTLGALDGEDLWAYRAHLLEGCADCKLELAQFEDVRDHLAFAPLPVEPSPILRDRLFDRIREADDVPVKSTIPTSNGDWKPYTIPGIRFRMLTVDPATRVATFLLKAQRGAVYPTHRHRGTEEMLMLEGELTIGGTKYVPGDFVLSDAGSIHATGETATGCMFLMRTSLDDELLA